jgi:cyclase
MNKLTPFAFVGILLLSISRVVSAATWDPAVTMVYSEEMAPGVFVVLDADDPVKNENGQSAYTSSGFIIGEKGVLVVDTYVNARITGQLIALIRKETQLPILYAVNTSYHGDHMYGNYLFPNTLIIQHEATRTFIETKFEDDLQFMKNQFGEGKGMEDSIPRTGDIMMNDGMDMMRIDLGGRIVEIHRFGFGQTAGDLQVWLPEEKIMWIGNPVPAEAPITPWLTEGGHLDSLETMRKLVEFLPDDARVVPGHGRPFTMTSERNGLTQIVDYLTLLDKNVRESVEKDMSLTETIRAHQMRDHTASGYELYNWTHNQLNMPCVYKHYYERLGKGQDPGPSARHCFHENTSDLEEQG